MTTQSKQCRGKTCPALTVFVMEQSLNSSVICRTTQTEFLYFLSRNPRNVALLTMVVNINVETVFVRVTLDTILGEINNVYQRIVGYLL